MPLRELAPVSNTDASSPEPVQPSRPYGRPGSAPARTRRRLPAGPRGGPGVRLLIALTWAYSVVPSLLQIWRQGRTVKDVTGDASLSGAASLASRGLFLAIVTTAIAVLLSTTRSDTRGWGRLSIYLSPWLCAAVLATVSGQGQPFSTLVYPAVGLVVWASAPPLRCLELVGWLTSATALLALGLAAATPFGLARSVGFEDKAVFGTALLAGPFSHPNALGLALVMGLPALLLISRPVLRTVALVVVLAALSWSFARTSMGVALLVLAVHLAFGRVGPHGRRLLASVVTALGGLALVVVPLTVHSPESYSYRGQIWLASLDRWRSTPWFGAGPDAYTVAARTDSDFGRLAFHGHNLLIHILLVGGIFMMSVVLLFTTCLLALAFRHLRSGAHTPVLVCVVFLYCSVLEIITDFHRPSDPGLVAWLCLAVVFFGRAEARHSPLPEAFTPNTQLPRSRP